MRRQADIYASRSDLARALESGIFDEVDRHLGTCRADGIGGAA